MFNIFNNQGAVVEQEQKPPLDQDVWNGDFITNPKYKKTS